MKRYVFIRLFDAGNQPIDRFVGPFVDLSSAIEFVSVTSKMLLKLATLSDAQIITTKIVPSGCHPINVEQCEIFLGDMQRVFKKL